jgi:D-alanyl-D-alanine-carboxypeptidase/D-alanyl-D-alanine-endopeptidase
VPALSNKRPAVGSLAVLWVGWATGSASAGALPERVAKTAAACVAAGVCHTLVFGVVDGDKSEVVAFGQLDGGKAADGDTVYEIGSITKTFTAILANAVLSGRLALDTPVGQRLPDFTIPSRGKEITLGDLATQHSGLPRLPPDFMPADPENPHADYDAAKLKKSLADYRLPRDPGAAYEYSNLGFGLLGFALAQSAYLSYGELVDREILKPLGMTMSGIALADAMRAHLAPGHDDQGKPAKNWDLDALAGAGAIRSSANDMLRYLRANMGIDSSPLSQAMTLGQQQRADMAKTMRVGLAWITTDRGIVWHNGGTGGYHAFLGFSGDRRLGVVVLSDSTMSIDDLGFATLQADAPLNPVFKEAALPAASLDDYVGTFKLGNNFLLKIFRMKDALYARATGQSALPIFPSAPNEFFARVGGISLTFTRDGAGAVTGLTLHQNGDHAAPKLTAAELPPEPNEIALDAATLGNYAGRYQFEFGRFDVVLNGDHLEARLTGQPAFPIFASGHDAFFYKIVEAELHFERDADHKVVAVVLHQNGRDQRASRIAAQPDTAPHAT